MGIQVEIPVCRALIFIMAALIPAFPCFQHYRQGKKHKHTAVFSWSCGEVGEGSQGKQHSLLPPVTSAQLLWLHSGMHFSIQRY